MRHKHMTQLMKKDVSSSIGSITLLLTFINLLCNVDILYFNALAIYGLDIFFLYVSFSIGLQNYVLSVPVHNCFELLATFCLIPFLQNKM